MQKKVGRFANGVRAQSSPVYVFIRASPMNIARLDIDKFAVVS